MQIVRTIATVAAVSAVAAVGVAAAQSDTQTTKPGAFQVTARQLQTNQRISSAAVARSNRALNYLAPIRTDASDKADDGTKGITALNAIVGSGKGWTSGQIADNAITTTKVADGAVGPTKLADAAVGPTKLADNAVATAKIANGAVTGPKIANGQIATAHLADGSVTSAKLADDVADLLPGWATKTDNAAAIHRRHRQHHGLQHRHHVRPHRRGRLHGDVPHHRRHVLGGGVGLRRRGRRAGRRDGQRLHRHRRPHGDRAHLRPRRRCRQLRLQRDGQLLMP